MAEAISTLLGNIHNLLDEEALSRVRSKLEELQSLVIQLQQLADNKILYEHDAEHDAGRWHSKDVSRHAYNIDDGLDTFLINVLSHRRFCNRIPGVLGRFAFEYHENRALRKVESFIQDVRHGITNLAGFPSSGREGSWNAMDQNERRSKQHCSYNFKEHNFIWGITEIEALVRLLTTESEGTFPVMSIFGRRGFGKTSFAKRIYNHIDVRHCFEAFAWVSIPRIWIENTGQRILTQTGVKNLYRDILKQLLSSDHYNKKEALMGMEEKALKEELLQVLKEMKCLLVLDNIIGDANDVLSILRRLDLLQRSKSIILIICDYYDRGLIELRGLSAEHNSWEIVRWIQFFNEDCGKLLKRKALIIVGRDLQIDPELETIGMRLAKLCRSPLLISLVGGVLTENNFSIDHWKMVLEAVEHATRTSVIDDVYQNVKHAATRILASEDENISKENILNKNILALSYYRHENTFNENILAVSYDRLPNQLKACFLHLAQFPNDEDMNVEMLYQMWIAEGMVSSHSCVGEETSMDIAEEYLAELARRSMVEVQVSDFSTARMFVSCRLHDLVRDFCLKLGERLGFFEDTQCEHFSSLSDRSSRRLSILNKFSGEFSEVGETHMNRELRSASEELRSLLLWNANGAWRVRISFPREIYEKFKLLRVLQMENFEIKGGKLPRDIGNLIHLRFLSLNGSAFEELPSSIGNLQFLQTLDLRVAEIVPWGIVVPNVLWKLKRLMHLYLPACHLVPEGQGKLRLSGLSKLETLVNFDNEKDELTDSEWMSLRCIEARVHGNKSISAMIDCINTHGHKLKETHLQVSFLGFSFEESSIPMEHVFNCSKLHHLAVTWGRCKLNEFKIPSSFSSNLIEFCLMRCQIIEDPMEFLGKFPKLQKLVLGKKTFTGKQMICEPSSFPAPKSLKISNLMHLEKLVIPQSSLPSLSCLEIVCCHKLEMIPDGLRFISTLTELKLTMQKEFNDRVRVVDKDEGVDFDKVRHVPLISLEDW